MQRQNTTSIFLAAQGVASKYNIRQILQENTDEDFFNRRTRIVCTLGPACWEVDQLVNLINCGMSVARFNFSHGDHAGHKACLDRLREAMKISGRNVGVMLDTKGPEIRSGFFKPECNGKIEIKAGQTLRLTTDYEFKGDSTCVACSYPGLPKSVKPGNKILMADGTVVLSVKEIGDTWVDTECMNDASFGERKNMNLPGVKVDLPVCGPKEVEDIQKWGIANGATMIAASFVQCADDIKEIRKVLGEEGKRIQIFPKIENLEGILNFDEILHECDGVMVARGDMGMEIPPEKVFLAQKMMIAKCNIAGKPVITATQMLESMINNPRPTRAEASDVSNSVLDGTDCVMLSGESANGKFPEEAVRTLSRCCLEAEAALDYGALFKAIHTGCKGTRSVPEAVCASAVEAALDVRASLIVCLTESGSTARLVAKYRPEARVIAVTSDDITEAHMRLMRGVETVNYKDMPNRTTDESFIYALQWAMKEGFVSKGEPVVCIHGTAEHSPGATNVVKIISCPDL